MNQADRTPELGIILPIERVGKEITDSSSSPAYPDKILEIDPFPPSISLVSVMLFCTTGQESSGGPISSSSEMKLDLSLAHFHRLNIIGS